MRDHLNSLHILSQDAVFIERSSIQEAVLFVLSYNKSVQDLTPKHRIICSSLQIYLTSFYLHSCYVAAGQASMHFRLVAFAVCVCVCVFAKHTCDNMAVQVRTLHSGRGVGCHLISFSRPAQSKFEVQPPPEHHFVEQRTHYCSVTQECGPCSACSAYCKLHKLLQMFYDLYTNCTNYKNAQFAQGAPICKIYSHCTTLHKLQLLDLNLLCLRPVQPRQY